MDSFIVISKFCMLLYCIIAFLRGNMAGTVQFILLCLFYISFNMLSHIAKDRKLKYVSLILSILLIIYAYNIQVWFFILLLPMNTFEIMEGFIRSIWFNIALIITLPFIININIVPEYVLAASLSLIIFKIARYTDMKIDILVNENDKLKEKNYLLHNSLNKDIEYERQVKYTSQLEERNKIAQHMHDSIGHTISGSLMQLEAAKIMLKDNPDAAFNIIQNVISVLRDGMENIRAALRNIKPPHEQLGINRLKLIVNEFKVNSSIDANLIYNGNLDRIPYAYWKIICENASEALTNCMKYSKATTVSVKLEVLNKLVKVEIKDNGIGSHIIKKGLGITGIEERCASVGGKVIIDGSNGFTLITLLPIGGDLSGN